MDDLEKKDEQTENKAVEPDCIEDNINSDDTSNDESNDNKSEDDQTIDEIIQDLRDETQRIIDSGEMSEDDSPLVKMAVKFVKKKNKLTIIKNLIAFPISVILLFALTGLIPWATYGNIYLIILVLTGFALIDTIYNIIIKCFCFTLYIKSFASIRQIILAVLILLLVLLDNHLGYTIQSIGLLVLTVEAYAIVRAIILFLLDNLIRNKKRSHHGK